VAISVIAIGHAGGMSWALSRPARSPSGVYYEVDASPRGDLLLWSSETGPSTWASGNEGALGILSFLINKIGYKGRWRVVVRRAPESRSASPTSGLLWRQDGVRKRDLDQVMGDLVARIEQGSFHPETAADGVV
jgi:hypothetical protein